jgi:hypothetical protein
MILSPAQRAANTRVRIMTIGAAVIAFTAIVFLVLTAGLEVDDQVAWSWACFATGCAIVHGGALVGSRRPMWVRVAHVVSMVVWAVSIFVLRIMTITA